MSSGKKNNSTEQEIEKEDEEDPELTQFKEEALKSCIIEKALCRPEANCCTYNKGYITQECFICVTCFLETKKRAVICLGCSIKCHEDNHEISPIGFKRHIKCDCGNNNFFTECKLKKKEEIDYDNLGNHYNHNMENKYCYCDSEDDGNSTMAQCFFCEDWFHKEHLNYFGNKKIEKIVKIEEKNEKIIEKNDEKIGGVDKNDGEIEKNDEENEKNDEELPILDLVCRNCVKNIKEILLGYNLKKILYGLIPSEKNQIITLSDETDKTEVNNINEEKVKHIDLLGKKRKLSKSEEEKKIKCKKKTYKSNEEILDNIIKNEQDIFLNCEILIKKLCRCEQCQEVYKKKEVEYLMNENLYKEWEERKSFDDIINDEKFIEEAKKENPMSLERVEGTINEFFNSKEYKALTVEQQLIIRGYIGELGNKLGEYISTLNHTTITVEDIYNFIKQYKDYFADLKNK